MGRRVRLDELIFRWYNLPPTSEVTVYFSDIDTAEIQTFAALRRSPLACEIVDKHTLKFKVAGATWIPIPGGRTLNIPALLSVKLPDTVCVHVGQLTSKYECVLEMHFLNNYIPIIQFYGKCKGSYT